MLAMSDTGVGMDAVTQASIFEPFYTTKEAGKGTGLGLSTVYGIVQQSAGGIYVYSEPGNGTTFKIYFPRASAQEERAPLAGVAIASSLGQATILLVEDDSGVRKAMMYALSQAGYDVLPAATGADALAVIARHGSPIDLVITDVVMPGMTGRELADRLQETHPPMGVLYVSGYTDDQVVRRGALRGDAPFLSKPFSARSLLEHVRTVLEGRFQKR
jgi:CheY-like chemotaxis protein